MSATTTAPVDLTPAGGGASGSSGPSLRRVVGLARANTILLTRNKMTLAYALVFPLTPLLLLLASDRGDVTAGIGSVTNVLMLGALFPVYYNLLSMVVTRRDELVLKRLRTGESRDGELLASMALPGLVVFAALSVLAVGVSSALGQPLPSNPVLVVATVLLTAVTFAGLAFWTAAWTRNAEAAQLTSMPVILLAVIGSLRAVLPEATHRYLDLTPGAALDLLSRIAWFGQDQDGAALSFADSFAAAGQPLAVLLGWTVLAGVLVRRSMRWEPRV